MLNGSRRIDPVYRGIELFADVIKYCAQALVIKGEVRMNELRLTRASCLYFSAQAVCGSPRLRTFNSLSNLWTSAARSWISVLASPSWSSRSLIREVSRKVFLAKMIVLPLVPQSFRNVQLSAEASDFLTKFFDFRPVSGDLFLMMCFRDTVTAATTIFTPHKGRLWFWRLRGPCLIFFLEGAQESHVASSPLGRFCVVIRIAASAASEFFDVPVWREISWDWPRLACAPHKTEALTQAE